MWYILCLHTLYQVPIPQTFLSLVSCVLCLMSCVLCLCNRYVYTVCSIWYSVSMHSLPNTHYPVLFDMFRRNCGGSFAVQVFGQLVLLGYAVAGFTPAAYQ